MIYNKKLSGEKMFSRHHRLQNFGKEKQGLLSTKKVLLVGCGGLGCSAAINLVCSGVSEMTLVDDDKVDISNLHRQHAFTHEDLGKWKAEVLGRECKKRNPELKVSVVLKRFTAETVGLIQDVDIVLDCSDNATTRLLLSKECQAARVPLVFGSAISYDGQVAVVYPDGPGIEEILPGLSQSTDTCDGLGVFGPVPVLIGCMQAIEAIKVLVMNNKSEESKNSTTTLSCYSSLDNSLMNLKIEKCSEPFEQLQQVVEELNDDTNIEKTWDEYLSHPQPKLLLDIRKNIEEDEELVGALSIKDNVESVQNVIKQFEKVPPIFMICELGARSKLMAKKSLKMTKTNDKNVTIYSIKGGTKQVFS